MVVGTRNRSTTSKTDSAAIDSRPFNKALAQAPATSTNTIDDIIDRAAQLTRSNPNAAVAANQVGHRRLTEKEEDALIVNDEAGEGDLDLNIPRFDVQPPNIVGGTMKGYQLAGLNWLVRLYETNVNGILADEMGLGKTLQTISLVAYLRQYRKVVGPHLVVVPKSTMGNWQNEFRKWCPDVNVFLLQGNKEERKVLVQTKLKLLKFDVCVTSYEMVLREKGPIRKIVWHLLVVDEAHRLKNENSCLSQVLRLFQSRARILITGTPLQNNLHELWSLLNFLMPNLFDSAGEFDAFLNVAEADDETGGQLLSKLHAILRPFLLRRLKTDVAKDIPPKIETMLYVGMSSMQKDIYRAVFQKDFNAIQGSTKNSKRLLNVMMQLRKAANHPYLFEGVEDRSLPVYGEHMITNSGKMAVLDKLLNRLKQQGSRVLVFSQMTRTLDILEDYCVYREYEYCRIDGGTNTEEREQQMSEFNAEGSSKFLFLLSSRAGGLGINLQTADIVVLYDSDWNPQMDLQAQDRAHRIGQKKTVHVYRFVTEHTIEEKIIERAEMKLRLDAMVIQQGRLADRNTKMSKDEMVALIRYGADEIFRTKDSSITDEDIDLILSKGAERTEQLAQKLSEFEKSVSNFAMSGDDQTAKQTFMTLAGAEQGSSKAENLAFITKVTSVLGKRDRIKSRTSYDVDQYYKEVMDDKRRKSGSGSTARPKRLPQLFDFQFVDFIDRDRLMDFAEKEQTRWTMESNGHDEMDLPPALTEEEQAEKERILSEGFIPWNRRDFNRYLRACERYGRHDIDSIIQAVPDKPQQEVRQYHITFWKRYTELDGWERIIKAIERGESRLVRGKEIHELIARAIQSAGPDPMQSLELKYGAQHKGKGYTELNDRFLLVKTAEFGYGDWERLHLAIMRSPLFTFDFFIKSRSSAELNRRVDVLARICEKEFNQKEPEGDTKPKISEKKSKPTAFK